MCLSRWPLRTKAVQLVSNLCIMWACAVCAELIHSNSKQPCSLSIYMCFCPECQARKWNRIRRANLIIGNTGIVFFGSTWGDGLAARAGRAERRAGFHMLNIMLLAMFLRQNSNSPLIRHAPTNICGRVHVAYWMWYSTKLEVKHHTSVRKCKYSAFFGRQLTEGQLFRIREIWGNTISWEQPGMGSNRIVSANIVFCTMHTRYCILERCMDGSIRVGNIECSVGVGPEHIDSR